MNQINNESLTLIAGGISASQSVPAAVQALVAQVSAGVSGATSSASANLHGDAAPYCNQYLHMAATPKNGDRNALGQQYSWGTWWDDMN